MAHRHDHHTDENYEYRNRDSGGNKALGITAIALLIIGLVFIAYLTLFNTDTRDRLEVNNFEITPQEESVGRSAVREAPGTGSSTVIDLPDPEFNMPALPERSTVDNNVATPPAESTTQESSSKVQGSMKTDRVDVQVGVE